MSMAKVSADKLSTKEVAINVIVDTGCANLSSVKFAVERLGFEVLITDDIDIIKKCRQSDTARCWNCKACNEKHYRERVS